MRKEVDREREDTRKAEMAPERERERLRRPEEESLRARRRPRAVRRRSVGGTTMVCGRNDVMEEIEMAVGLSIEDCKRKKAVDLEDDDDDDDDDEMLEIEFASCGE